MNNKLLDIQEALMKQIKRIDNDKLSNENLVNEIARSNALSNTANTFIKTVNVNIRIKELANRFETTKEKINEELGL